MVSYTFKCKNEKCFYTFEKFRFGLSNYEKWKNKEIEITCPKCNNNKVVSIINKGSGQFKPFNWR